MIMLCCCCCRDARKFLLYSCRPELLPVLQKLRSSSSPNTDTWRFEQRRPTSVCCYEYCVLVSDLRDDAWRCLWRRTGPQVNPLPQVPAKAEDEAVLSPHTFATGVRSIGNATHERTSALAIISPILRSTSLEVPLALACRPLPLASLSSCTASGCLTV